MPSLLFTSQGRIGLIDADGQVRYLDFDVEDQVTWQPSAVFGDGRLLLLSMEARRDGPGRPFDQYYHKTPTHMWIYDPEADTLSEVAAGRDLAVFSTPQLLLEDTRLLVQVVRDEGGQVYNTDLEGADARPVTALGEGLPYGFSLSPDGQRLAYHLASPSGYQIWTSDPYGGQRVLVAAHDEYLYFGPRWAPDSQWLAYMACRFGQDPGHDWADLCISRPDGSEQRLLTEGQALWFAATYGPPQRPGGGSNMPAWTPDGALLAACRAPGTQVPWRYAAQRPDVDHFNRDFCPDQARGGVQIRRFDVDASTSAELSEFQEGVWDFRQSVSPDGERLVFCRARTGDGPAIWMAGASGEAARPLTRGWQGLGADHPRWMGA